MHMCSQARKEKKKRNRNPHEIWPMYRTLIPPYFSIWLAVIWFPWPLHSRYEAMPTYIPEGRLTQIRVSLFPPKSCLRHLEKNETPGYKSHPLMRVMSWLHFPTIMTWMTLLFFVVFFPFDLPQRNQLSDASPKERWLQIRRNLFQTQKPPDAR